MFSPSVSFPLKDGGLKGFWREARSIKPYRMGNELGKREWRLRKDTWENSSPGTPVFLEKRLRDCVIKIPK